MSVPLTLLQRISAASETEKRFADQLYQVWLLDGQEVCILIHVEIQSQYETEFSRRMYIYNYRLDQKIKEFEEQRTMPLLSNMERRGIEIGKEIGKEIGAIQKAHDDIKIVLTARLGEIPSELADSLGQISNLSRLDELLKLAATVNSLWEFQQSLEGEQAS